MTNPKIDLGQRPPWCSAENWEIVCAEHRRVVEELRAANPGAPPEWLDAKELDARNLARSYAVRLSSVTVRVTRHALDRAQRLDPFATDETVRRWWETGQVVPHDVLQAITQRTQQPTKNDAFRLAKNVPGIVVVTYDRPGGEGVVVTVLRLLPSQVAILAPERAAAPDAAAVDQELDGTTEPDVSAPDVSEPPADPEAEGDPMSAFTALGFSMTATASVPARAWIGQIGKTSIHVRRFGVKRCSLAIRGPGGLVIANVAGLTFPGAAQITMAILTDRK